MTLRIPRGGAFALIAFGVSALAIFLVLAARFGGPSLRLADPYALTAPVADTQGLAVRSDVLVRGVRVGRVAAIEVEDGIAAVRLEIDDLPLPVRRDATLRIGMKTLLGEAYVDLDPGRRGPVLPDGARLGRAAVRPSVEVDEALEALGEPARADLRGTLAEAGRGARSPRTAARVGETLAQLRLVTGGLRELGTALEAQAPDLAAAVEDSRAVVGEVAARQRALTTLVGDTQRTLDAVGARERDLRGGLRELPRLLHAARAALEEGDPLVREARPLLRDLRDASPSLAGAFTELPAVARDASGLLAAAPRLERAAAPLLAEAGPLVGDARPAARSLGPALANLVPVVRFLSPRRRAIAAWFSNTADLGLNGDSKGSWARFFIFLEPGTASGRPGGRYSANAYTRPGDAAANRPYTPGDYERLKPFGAPSP